MNAKSISEKMKQLIEACDNAVEECRNSELEEYIMLVKTVQPTGISMDCLNKLKMLEKYEETLIKLRKRKAVWPQFVEWLTSNIESQLKGEMNLIDIEFESCSADAFDIMDWNNVIRICYKKTEFDKNICIEISYSNDGGYTTSSSKTFRIIDDRNVNGIDEYSPAQILEIVMKHIRRSGHKIGEIVEI